MTMASLSSTVVFFVNEPLFILSILGGKDKNFKLFAKNCHIKKKILIDLTNSTENPN